MVLLYGELYSIPTYNFTESTEIIVHVLYSKIVRVERKSNMEFAWRPCCFMCYKTGFNQRVLLTCTWKVPGSFLVWHTDCPGGLALSLGLPEKSSSIFLTPTQTWVLPFNLVKPTGHVMHQQFNIQQLYALPTLCIYLFCIYLRTNSDLCHSQHKLIGFYNRDEKCLLRDTHWVLK